MEGQLKELLSCTADRTRTWARTVCVATPPLSLSPTHTLWIVWRILAFLMLFDTFWHFQRVQHFQYGSMFQYVVTFSMRLDDLDVYWPFSIRFDVFGHFYTFGSVWTFSLCSIFSMRFDILDVFRKYLCIWIFPIGSTFLIRFDWFGHFWCVWTFSIRSTFSMCFYSNELFWCVWMLSIHLKVFGTFQRFGSGWTFSVYFWTFCLWVWTLGGRAAGTCVSDWWLESGQTPPGGWGEGGGQLVQWLLEQLSHDLFVAELELETTLGPP